MSVVIAMINGIFLARFSGWLMLIVLGLTAASVLAVQLVSKRIAPIARELTTAQAAMFGTATGGISSIESLKANGAEESLFSRWASSYSRTLVLDQRMGVVNSTVNAIPNLSVLLMTTAVIGVGGAQVISGSISLGDLVGFQSLLMPFLAANTMVLNSSALLRQLIGDSRTSSTRPIACPSTRASPRPRTRVPGRARRCSPAPWRSRASPSVTSRAAPRSSSTSTCVSNPAPGSPSSAAAGAASRRSRDW